MTSEPFPLCRRLSLRLLISTFCLAPGVLVHGGEEVSAEHARFFESEIRPLLAEHCWSCHGADKQKSNLRLDSLADLLAGGDSGPAITPGSPQESLLIEAVRYESFEMPPTAPLSDKEIATLERWVEIGAPWPGAADAPSGRGLREKITDEDRAWWAFQPVAEPEIPTLDDAALPDNPIDAFVQKRLYEEGLSPAPEANRPALLRRLYFDLIGLPPSPEQVAAFLGDPSPDAYERIVDQLLDSPRYGERWARHWLDLVRYADSDGYRADHFRPHAWRYRDYVIESFNADKRYDRFVQEQIAGDELFPGDPEALIATGYLRHGIYEYNNRDARGQWTTMLEDVTDTTGDVFLGMGMQCAKCHDHKFDPILQRDYFRLQAFFAPLVPREAEVADEAERTRYREQSNEWESATAEIRKAIDAIESGYRKDAANAAVEMFPPDIQAIVRKPESEREPLESQLHYLVHQQVLFEYSRLDTHLKGQDKERVIELRKELAEFDHLRPAPLPVARTATDVAPKAPPTRIPKRSDENIEPGFLTLLDESPAEIEPIAGEATTGRRAALARWLTRPDNPLSTRVIVNRVWQYHFGRGLAPNSSDFGRLGGVPTHPELLDWLTTQFIRDGWSLKQLHRRIVTSATYRQSASHPEFLAHQTRDPANQFYWRGHTRRLDAEQIRDAVLAVSGELRTEAGGESVLPDVPRRTIYTRVMRNDRDPLLDVFDLPLFFSSESSRNTTTTPVQSLLMINSAEILQHARRFAARVWEASPDLRERISHLWRLAYARPPQPEEIEAALQFLEDQQRQLDGPRSSGNSEIVIGRIPYRDGQAVAISPESELQRMTIAHAPQFDVDDFSIESYFQLRSIYDSGAVRTIAAKWSGQSGEPGWAFGVTGNGSRRKPQTLVMQMWGTRRDGSFGEAAVFSDQHVALEKPYFVAATVELAGQEPGVVTFYLKDLSDDDQPMEVVRVEHEITGDLHNTQPLALGGRSRDASGWFDGLVDDVRLSRGRLDEAQLIFTSAAVADNTIGYWQFEVEPGVLQDSSDHGLPIQAARRDSTAEDPLRAAFRDLCHTILNSNEFLYVQ